MKLYFKKSWQVLRNLLVLWGVIAITPFVSALSTENAFIGGIDSETVRHRLWDTQVGTNSALDRLFNSASNSENYEKRIEERNGFNGSVWKFEIVKLYESVDAKLELEKLVQVYGGPIGVKPSLGLVLDLKKNFHNLELKDTSDYKSKFTSLTLQSSQLTDSLMLTMTALFPGNVKERPFKSVSVNGLMRYPADGKSSLELGESDFVCAKISQREPICHYVKRDIE